MINGNGGGKFAHWAASGALATVGWFIILIVYCTFRAFKIEDPFLGQAFLLLTGLWVGNLTLAQGKKQAKTEEKAEQAVQKVDELQDAVDRSVRRADASERRETEWSKHRDHRSEEQE